MATQNKGSSGKGSQENRQDKNPASRTSKKTRKPVTIDLEPTKVVSANTAKSATTAEPVSSGKQSSNPKGKPASAVPTVKAAAGKTTTPSDRQPVDRKPDAARPAADSSANKKPAKTAQPASATIPKSPPKPTTGSPLNAAKAAPSPSGEDKNSSGSSAGKLVAGIVGGGVALAGAYLLQQSGMIPASSPDNSGLKAEISRIDETLNDLSGKQSASPALKTLIARITELEASQKSLTGKLETQGKDIETATATSTSLATTVEQTAKTTQQLEQSISSGSAGENAALSTLDERLKTLEAGSTSTSNTDKAEIDALKTQLGELAAKIEQIIPADTSKQDGLIQEATAGIAALTTRLAEVAQSTGDTQTAANEKFATLDNSVGQIRDNIAGLVTRIDSVEEVASTPQKDEQRVARALAVAGLKSAIDSGANFESALALVKSLSPDMDATASLEPFAISGVPGISSLENTFLGIADKIIASTAPADNKNAVSRLFTNLRALVKIKSTGAIAGDTSLAIVSRIEDGLKKSDLATVIKEWERLPDAAKAISNDWIGSVKARQLANELIDNLLNKFITSASDAGN